jgi:hypothetical protein
MDEGSTPTARPRLGTPEDPIPVRSGRQVAMVLGTMVVFFFFLVLLAMWGAKNG